MFSRRVIDDSRNINDTSSLEVTIISDATTWSITYNRHSDDHNIFKIQATAAFNIAIITFSCLQTSYLNTESNCIEPSRQKGLPG
jgi:hypothetical protein